MDYKETYDKFWQIPGSENFEDYERNLLLYKFFPEQRSGEVRVADIAGGPGIVSEWLNKIGYKVFYVEFSDVAIEKAKKRGLQNIHKVLIEKEGDLPFSENFFDYIFMGDIIEHLFNPSDVLKEIKRVLKPGGRLIMSCPNIAYWRFRLYYLLDGDFQRIDVTKQKPWEQQHIRFYNIKILKEFLNKIGFEFIKYAGVNNIWHSNFFVKFIPNLFSHTIIVEFKNIKVI